MRNQEQILLLRKQPGLLKHPSKVSRRGFIGRLFALSCSNKHLRFTAPHLGFGLGLVERAAKDTEE